MFVCDTKIRKRFELAIQKSNYFSLLFEKFWTVSPNVDSVFPSGVLMVVYGCHLMVGLSGEGVIGQRHDGLNKEIRSVPLYGFGCY